MKLDWEQDWGKLIIQAWNDINAERKAAKDTERTEQTLKRGPWRDWRWALYKTEETNEKEKGNSDKS